MNLVPFWVSHIPSDIVPHLDLIAVDSFLALPGTGDSGPYLDVTLTRGFWYPSGPQPDLVTLVFNWASPGPSEYAPSGPHLDLVTLVPTWATSVHGST